MNEKGIALIIAFMIIVILTIAGTALIMRSVSEDQNSQVYMGEQKAFWLADAGLQKAQWELNRNNCTGCVQCNNTSMACTNCACAGANKCISGTLGTGDYNATINTTAIASVGYYPNRNASDKKTRTLTRTIAIDSAFAYAVYAKNKVVLLNNASVDSYNSGNGAYGGSNILSGGNVGTNSNAAADITLGDNALIRGNASTAPGGTVSLSNNAAITGTVTHTNNRSLPPITIPPSVDNLSDLGTISVANNGSSTLSAGNYKYTSITLANNGTLTINGTVNLYLTSATTAIAFNNNCNIVLSAGAHLNLYVNGAIDVKNNSAINTSSHNPADLQIYSTYTGANGIKISNNGVLYGVAYAPDTDIVLANNVDTFGAFVGKTVDLSNNADIHYDETLSQLQNVDAGYTFSNWQEN